jgi:hypothetical protein
MSFQTAKFSLTLHKDHVTFLTGITPPQLMILASLHWKESQGTPIGADLQLEPGVALTVDQEGKAAEAGYFHQGSGRQVEPKEAVAPVTHVRTMREEAERLKKKYACTIPHTPGNTRVFTELFGSSPAVRLPETFDEVLEGLGLPGILPVDGKVDKQPDEVTDLAKLERHELVTKAIALKVKINQTDSKETIIGKILVAASEKPAGASEAPSGDNVQDEA